MNLNQVIEFAKAKHAGQFRRDGVTPYWTHIEAVMSRVHTDLEKMVAALHDTAKDRRVTWTELYLSGIPERVIEHVHILTRPEDESYDRYIERIKRSGSIAINVKIADLLSNLSDSPTQSQIIKYATALLRLV